MSKTGIIYGVNGPVIYLKGDPGFKISEMVYVCLLYTSPFLEPFLFSEHTPDFHRQSYWDKEHNSGRP